MFWQKYGIEKKDLLTPASILIGAILISTSICFSAGKFPFYGSGAAVKADVTVKKVAARADAPTLGTGKVEIVEFSDFQCPFCKKFEDETFAKIKTDYVDTGKVKIIFRYFPLSFHDKAEKAAEAGECASKQNKFWQYHDLLFKNSTGDGTGLAISDLKKYAQQLGLDTAKFNTCLDNGDSAQAVAIDLKAGQEAGVTGTPSFFINGKMIVGALPFVTFKQAIDEALK